MVSDSHKPPEAHYHRPWWLQIRKSNGNQVKLAQNEQIIYDIISKRKLMDLVELKDLCGLSNKQWDKGIKSLGKQNITKVVKTDTGLTVEYIQ